MFALIVFAGLCVVCFNLNHVTGHMSPSRVFRRSLLTSLSGGSLMDNGSNQKNEWNKEGNDSGILKSNEARTESINGQAKVQCENGICSLPNAHPSNSPTSFDDINTDGESSWDSSKSTTLMAEDSSNVDQDLTQEKVGSAEETVDEITNSNSITSSNNTISSPLVTPEEQSLAVQELCKLGWTKQIAMRALQVTNFDVTSAAELLDQEAEEILATQRLVALDWDENVAQICLREAQGNETAAVEMLLAEETRLTEEFNSALQEMCEAGWEEIAARTALRMQFSLQHRKSLGFNDTFSPEELEKIRFSLRPSVHSLAVSSVNSVASLANGTLNNENLGESSRSDKDISKGVITTPSNTTRNDGEKNKKTEKKDSESPKVKKEEVVLYASMSNLQSLVLDSAVPVVVDVYADWCGPCRQLTPMLEEAAVKANGLFRLVKVNADKERPLVDLLQVTGFPTLFTVSQGEIVDRVVGGLPPKELQNYLVRAVTGYGARVQLKENELPVLKSLTQRVHMAAGMASFTSQKKSLLWEKTEAAMQLPDAFVTHINPESRRASYEASEGVRLILTYLENARQDIRNTTRTTLLVQNKFFQAAIVNNSAAIKLLEVAGFRPSKDVKASTLSKEDLLEGKYTKLVLIHKNPALLSLVAQKVDECINKKKFSSILTTFPPASPASTSSPQKVQITPTKKSNKSVPSIPNKPASSNSASTMKRNKSNVISKAKSATVVKKFSKPSVDSSLKKPAVFTSITLKDPSHQVLKKGSNEVNKGIAKLTNVDRTKTLRQVLQQLLSTQSSLKQVELLPMVEDLFAAGSIQVTFPSPKKTLKDASLLDRAIGDIFSSSILTLTIMSSAVGGDQKDNENKSRFFLFGSHKNKMRRGNQQGKPASKTNKVHTMSSMGLFQRNDGKDGNEYFNGDSTVMEANPTNSERNADDDEEN